MSDALGETETALRDGYSVLLMDLDGTLHRGSAGVEAAAEAMTEARRSGLRLAFVTNNASRTPVEVSGYLDSIGVAADPSEVTTSAQAGARALAKQVAPGTAVLVVGGPALANAVEAEGLVAVWAANEAAAMIQGWDPSLDWRTLAEGAYALEAGALWIVTNADPTLPTVGGIAPGNGSFVELLQKVTGRRPDLVAGKPAPDILLGAAADAGRSALAVGDRLDTDVAGAMAAGLDSLLVLTGVTSVSQLLTARPDERPTFVSPNLRGLAEIHEPVVRYAGGWGCGPTRVVGSDGLLELSEGGTDLQVLRALVAAAWEVVDEGGQPRLDSRAERRLAGF